MGFKVFLDANVLLDFVLKRANYEQARIIISAVVNGSIQAFFTPSVVQITAYWTAKAYGIEKTKEVIGALLADIECIDIPHDQVVSAVHSSMDDIENALQYYAALYHHLDYVISRDKAFQNAAIASLPVLSPEEFIKMVGVK
ncbi:PIN domain-containing protein [bacterium A37T11]|nr:PIN domain-containing protein [bacterium A37T11]